MSVELFQVVLGKDADVLPVRALAVENYVTFGFGEECVVLALADVETGVVLRATLADNDVTGVHTFATVAFYSQSIRFTISTVFDGSLTRFS
jgi:alpha-D-ribose 1-methylphosphonate 5-triphosphate synthase subunit PhnH